MTKVVLDPVTRIEGHLKVEVDVNDTTKSDLSKMHCYPVQRI